MTKPAVSTSSFPWRWLVAGGILAVAAYVYFIALRPVAVVVPVVRGRAVNSVPGSVEVKAESVLPVKSEAGGRIVTSSLNPGRVVTKDEVLLQLDTGDVDIEIERIANDLEAARRRAQVGSTLRAERDNKLDSLNELERRVKAGAFSVAEFEREKRLYQQLVQRVDLEEVNLKLGVENLENALRAKQREKAKMTIVAPFDGVIAELNIAGKPGELIGRDFTLATLISKSRVVEAKISEENYAGLIVGQAAGVSFLSYGPQQYRATLTKKLPTANAETQRYTIHLNVEIPEDKLVPGLTGEVVIVIGQRDNQMIIPRRALRSKQVMLVESGQVVVRSVEVGYTALNEVEILKGVSAGDLVIVEELDTFRPGQRVRTRTAN
ncbi:efflux RND transporter periplasmic adaptor subunit [Oleiharenicola lentus]|uniref:Efflux RND transporter periplasmic adaptor subunit n=1 Tax=Oleiharenicola lentus TaxID=2508720 RepID=A0A4Q1C9N0_9BACT|nr:efflux RND transporter periplasmic adaptor subunit [Oleiharenicola lentus]RXK55737.1 efflux RND transporter periplasmic adaptor subunit [Oleiharenicola lentus]